MWRGQQVGESGDAEGGETARDSQYVIPARVLEHLRYRLHGDCGMPFCMGSRV